MLTDNVLYYVDLAFLYNASKCKYNVSSVKQIFHGLHTCPGHCTLPLFSQSGVPILPICLAGVFPKSDFG